MSEPEKKPSILVVDDDRELRHVISDLLIEKGYQVRQAENGLIAKTILDLDSDQFDVVLSDIRMPDLDGIALMKHLHANKQIRVILMTGFSEILESKQAFELGASDFIAKPFKMADLYEMVDRCLNPKPTLEVEQEEPANMKYCQIPIDQFVTASHLISDVFVQLSESKYIRVANEGDKVEVSRFKTYQAKHVDYLYVRREDFYKYVNFNLKVAKAAATSSLISVKQKANLFRHTTAVLLEQVCLDGVDKRMLGSAQTVVGDVVKTIIDDGDILELLDGAASRQDRLYAHSLAVAVICTLVAQANGWEAPATMFKVTLGGLFHDIGKREIPEDVIAKSRLHLSAEEIQLLESHPIRSRRILMNLSSLPEEVSVIAYHHHENQVGTGYPQRLTSERIHPVGKLVAVADRLCTYVYPVQSDAKAVSIREALDRMATIGREDLDTNFLRKLLALFP